MKSPLLKKLLMVLPYVAILYVLARGIYWYAGEPRKAESQQPAETSASRPESGLSKAMATGPMAAFLVHTAPKDITAFIFTDKDNKQRSLSDWKGKVVLLNLWATWCAPCRKEMPDVAKLQKELGGAEFEVVALSIDRKGLAASQAFLKETGADNLAAFVDPEGNSLKALQALGLPATVLIDRNGKERGRLLGPADWSSPESKAIVKLLLQEN